MVSNKELALRNGAGTWEAELEVTTLGECLSDSSSWDEECLYFRRVVRR